DRLEATLRLGLVDLHALDRHDRRRDALEDLAQRIRARLSGDHFEAEEDGERGQDRDPRAHQRGMIQRSSKTCRDSYNLFVRRLATHVLLVAFAVPALPADPPSPT